MKLAKVLQAGLKETTVTDEIDIKNLNKEEVAAFQYFEAISICY